MDIGFVGLGRLGLPVSVTIALKTHTVYGYEIDESKRHNYKNGTSNLYEPNLDNMLQDALASKHLILVDTLKDAVLNKDLIFIAVPTPTNPGTEYFDTSILLNTLTDVGNILKSSRPSKKAILVVISTILPMTMRREVVPTLEACGLEVGKDVGLCYSAQFIAMGTTSGDYLTPEFCLIGESDPESGEVLEEYYATIVPRTVPLLHMTWEDAELTKMVYNVYIGAKIVVANTIMEMAHKIPYANVDVVSSALSYATKRIVGPRYMRGGMGDGGGCHPRDVKALSWLAEKLHLSTNIFDAVMSARDRQTAWLAELGTEKGKSRHQNHIIMGVRYKMNTNLIDYSPSLLLAEKLQSYGAKPFLYDPLVPAFMQKPDLQGTSVFYLTVDAPFVHEYKYPYGSIVLDIWRCLSSEEILNLQKNRVAYLPIGRAEDAIDRFIREHACYAYWSKQEPSVVTGE